MSQRPFEILSITRLKRGGSRTILERVEHAGARFIITDYGAAVAELGPLSESAERFMTHGSGEPGEEVPHAPKRSKRRLIASVEAFVEERRRQSGM